MKIDSLGKIVIDNDKVKEVCRKYVEKLLNEEIVWDIHILH